MLPALVAAVRNAGAIFVGHQAAESFGDYLAGSSHVLPTDGAARFTGGVSTLTFMKAMTVQQVARAPPPRSPRPPPRWRGSKGSKRMPAPPKRGRA